MIGDEIFFLEEQQIKLEFYSVIPLGAEQICICMSEINDKNLRS